MRTPTRQETQTAWARSMNVPADELRTWLDGPESASVGTRSPDARWSVGQLAGLATVDLLAVPLAEWDEADLRHARRTLGYVRRHRAQFPRGDVSASRWRHSLRNWGHDPLWAQRLALPAESGEILLDGRGVGWVDFDPMPHGVEVLDLAIDPAHREQGLGTAALHELARRHECSVDVRVEPGTTAADWFGRRGFAALGGDPAALRRCAR